MHHTYMHICRSNDVYYHHIGPFAVAHGGPGPLEFGEAYCELSSLGWIHAVAWSPSGESLAFAGAGMHGCMYVLY